MSKIKKFRLAVIPGDGIGTEVVEAGLRVINHLAKDSNGKFEFESDFFPWGCEYYLENGKMMDEDGVEKLRDYDAIYLGLLDFQEYQTMLAYGACA